MEWEAHWQFMARMLDAPAPPPEPEPVTDVSPWEVEKARNRLQRVTEKIESRRWLPTAANRLSGRAVQELRDAHDLLAESGRVLTEVRE